MWMGLQQKKRAEQSVSVCVQGTERSVGWTQVKITESQSAKTNTEGDRVTGVSNALSRMLIRHRAEWHVNCQHSSLLMQQQLQWEGSVCQTVKRTVVACGSTTCLFSVFHRTVLQFAAEQSPPGCQRTFPASVSCCPLCRTSYQRASTKTLFVKIQKKNASISSQAIVTTLPMT